MELVSCHLANGQGKTEGWHAFRTPLTREVLDLFPSAAPDTPDRGTIATEIMQIQKSVSQAFSQAARAYAGKKITDTLPPAIARRIDALSAEMRADLIPASTSEKVDLGDVDRWSTAGSKALEALFRSYPTASVTRMRRQCDARGIFSARMRKLSKIHQEEDAA